MALYKDWATMIGDASNAYWHVPEKENVVMTCPPELAERFHEQGWDQKRKIVLIMKKLMYGKRNASVGFYDYVCEQLGEDYDRCKVRPTFFRHKINGTVLEIYQDDIHATGPDLGLERLKVDLNKLAI